MALVSYTSIYGLVDPRNEAIRYIGKTDFPEHRLKQHLCDAKRKPSVKVYRWVHELATEKLKPSLKVLCKVDSNKWKEAEVLFISHYKQFCNLLNSTDGGEGLLNASNETKSKISLSKKGKTAWNKGKSGIYSNEVLKKMRANGLRQSKTHPKSKDHMKMMLDKMLEKQHLWINNPRPNRRRTIFCINIITGEKTKYIGIKEAAIVLNISRTSIDNNLSGRSKIVNKKYTFEYGQNGLFTKGEISHNAKSIVQMNLKGDFIKEWESINQAHKSLNIGGVSRAISLGGKHVAGGFLWKFKN